MSWKRFTALAVLALPLTACPADTTPSSTTAQVTVVQVADADQSAPCTDARSELSYQVNTDSTAFELVVDLRTPRCTPLDAKAVIYAMPATGGAWPQTLVSVEPFTLSAAGTTTVTFTRGCGSAQFDVITGAAPATINTGFDHGPLLFPGDLATSQQSFGDPCPTGTSTTDAPTTTAEPTTTTEATTTTTEATTTTTSTTVPPTTTTSTTTTTVPPTTTTTSTTVPPTTTTTTTTPVLPPLVYQGVAERAAGCFSGAFGTTNSFEQVLGADGWWNFRFNGCNLGSTETIALHEGGSGSPFADEFKAPTGYKCRMSIDTTTDVTPYYTTQIGSIADTGGLIFWDSDDDWPNGDVTWRITCIQL